jgi:cytochrome c oxidase subunit 2
MVGRVIVMDPTDYELWLSGATGVSGPSSVASGEELFTTKACNTCHRADTTARAPMLWGLFGKTVLLSDGQSIAADETYIRESILNPAAKIVTGYQPIMPTYRGQLTEEEIIQLIRYIQSLKPPASAAPEGPAASETVPAATAVPGESSRAAPAKDRHGSVK